MKTFDEKLQSYAELTAKVGANVQAGQVVRINASVEAASFVRMVVAECYRLGAKNVIVDYVDDELTRLRFEKAPLEVFENYPEWEKIKLESLSDENCVFLNILSQDPDLLGGISSEKIAANQKAAGTALMKFRQALTSDKNSWSIVAFPGLAWAKKVFPDDLSCVEKLWEAIFAACRIEEPDPVLAWEKHNENLHKRVAYLNERKYRYLHYRAKGTDLRIGLHPSHVWCGAGSTNAKGHDFMANMPTEEVFTVPNCHEVDGVVQSKKPLSYAGNIIDNFSVTFKDGRAVLATAEKGEQILLDLIKTDEGAACLGEVALVAHDSPISNSGVLFYQTLFDENASSHLAFGEGYAFCVEGGKKMSQDELKKAFVNTSLVHVDFMIGCSDMDIDGVLEDGSIEPIFRSGNWAF